jgi:glycosyltransferase involved in cell wall biosynthesis
VNKPPRLSVIVANFNQERYLAECLDSILNQTDKDLEIVVYDDGSKDGSLDILRNYQQSRPVIIRVIQDPVNRGAAYARHRAILASRGEYLTTLDSDDFYCHPQKLEKEFVLIQKIKEEEGKDIIAFSNILLLKNDEPPCLWGTAQNIREGSIGPEIMGRECLIPRDFIIKRDSYFRAGGYDVRLKVFEDWDLKIRLAFRHEFRYTGEVGTAYRRHGEGLSALPSEELIRWIKIIFHKNIHLLDSSSRTNAEMAIQAYCSALAKKQSLTGRPPEKTDRAGGLTWPQKKGEREPG